MDIDNDNPPSTDDDFRRKIELRFQAYDRKTGTIDLSQCDIDDRSIDWVVSQLKLLDGIATLDIDSNQIGDGGAKVLASCQHLSGLNELSIRSNQIGKDGAKALAASPHLPGLQMLAINMNQIGKEGAKALAASRRLSGLRELYIGGNQIGDAGVKALAASPNLSQLHTLEISSSQIGKAGAMALAASPHLSRLYTLFLTSNRFGKAGVIALSASPHLSGLQTLYIGSNQIGDAGAKALAASAHLSGLYTLEIWDNQIGEEGARALAASPNLSGLRWLDISSNEIREEGAKWLAASAHLSRLHTLDIGGNRIGHAGTVYLAGSPHLSSLHKLNIGSNQIGKEGAMALALSQHLSGLHTLNVESNEISDPELVIALCDKILTRRPTLQDDTIDGQPLIEIERNPLRWKGPGGKISQTVLGITDPAELKRQLNKVRDLKARAQVFMARIVMSGPTEHGKSHLAGWLTAKTEEQRSHLRMKQDRGVRGDGTWGASRIKANLPFSEHHHPGLPDVQISVIDCGGHPQQVLSHQNLYFSDWSRSVFILCVRADRDFSASWGDYHLGLIADLKSMSIRWSRGRGANTLELDRQHRQPNPAGNSNKLLVVLVATHADQARMNGSKLEFPSAESLSQDYGLISALEVKAWDALKGADISEIKRAIGAQLAKLPELQVGLPKEVVAVGEEIDRLFSPVSALSGTPELNSLPFSEFKRLCKRFGVEEVDYQHALRELDTLGYVVAPRCRETSTANQQILLNPRFSQHFLYEKLLRDSRPADGILEEEQYRILTGDLSEADRSTLESLMESCLVAFKIRGRGNQPLGWLIPDLLQATNVWPKWTDVLWSAHLKVAGFLNESIFFEFVREEQEWIERTIHRNSARVSLHRNWCVLQDADSRAMVRIDVRRRTIDIEVRGGRTQAAENWCRFLLRGFERTTETKGTVKQGPGGRGVGKPVDFEKDKLIRLWHDWVHVRQSTDSTKRKFAKKVLADSATSDKYALRLAHPESLLIDDVINAIDYGGRLSRRAE